MNVPERDTQYTREIVCPVCGHKFSNSWEYNQWGEGEITCINCDEEFFLAVNVDITYSTSKLEAE